MEEGYGTLNCAAPTLVKVYSFCSDFTMCGKIIFILIFENELIFSRQPYYTCIRIKIYTLCNPSNRFCIDLLLGIKRSIATSKVHIHQF